MTRQTATPAQRARRLLNQAAMQRVHRRNELSRLLSEDEAEATPPNLDPSDEDEAEHTDGERPRPILTC